MRSGVYKFAGVPVRITSQYDAVHLMCRAYAVDDEPALSVCTTMEDIECERRMSMAEHPGEAADAYPEAYLETLAVYRRMAVALLDHDVLLIHGSAIAAEGEGLLFTALSGTGKSTHTRLWRQMLGGRFMMVNDDKPLIAVGAGDAPAMVCGTPWDGKHHLSNNVACPLRAIVHLMRGQENSIRECDAAEMFPTLLQQTYTTPDPAVMAKTLELLSRLCGKVRFYELRCNMAPEAAEVAYKGIFA